MWKFTHTLSWFWCCVSVLLDNILSAIKCNKISSLERNIDSFFYILSSSLRPTRKTHQNHQKINFNDFCSSARLPPHTCHSCLKFQKWDHKATDIPSVILLLVFDVWMFHNVCYTHKCECQKKHIYRWPFIHDKLDFERKKNQYFRFSSISSILLCWQ